MNTSSFPISPELCHLLAPRRVRRGHVVLVGNGLLIDHGRRVPDYLREHLHDLINDGHLDLGDERVEWVLCRALLEHIDSFLSSRGRIDRAVYVVINADNAACSTMPRDVAQHALHGSTQSINDRSRGSNGSNRRDTASCESGHITPDEDHSRGSAFSRSRPGQCTLVISTAVSLVGPVLATILEAETASWERPDPGVAT